MTFQMNGVNYLIKEVDQKEFWDYKCDEQDGYYYGQTHFPIQEIWISRELPTSKKKKTLYHELMHCYINEYISTRDIKLTEEQMCDISASSHDIIHDIVEKYFNE